MQSRHPTHCIIVLAPVTSFCYWNYLSFSAHFSLLVVMESPYILISLLGEVPGRPVDRHQELLVGSLLLHWHESEIISNRIPSHRLVFVPASVMSEHFISKDDSVAYPISC